MRIMVTYAIPIDKGNELIRSGEIANVLQSIIEEYKPEAAYFYPNDAGERAGAMVVEMQEGTDLPKIAEALFLGLNARVNMRPCFGLDDMEHLGEVIGPIVEKYG